jgi:hypothetical protein
MKLTKKIIVFTTLAILLLTSLTGFAQDMSHHTNPSSLKTWFGILEFPFLFVCVFFAFQTATALKGGTFGKGMNQLAWGFLVMAVGHLHMQLDHFMGVNLFNELLGETLGMIAWFSALVVTWGLSGLGFYTIYKASKGK